MPNSLATPPIDKFLKNLKYIAFFTLSDIFGICFLISNSNFFLNALYSLLLKYLSSLICLASSFSIEDELDGWNPLSIISSNERNPASNSCW